METDALRMGVVWSDAMGMRWFGVMSVLVWWAGMGLGAAQMGMFRAGAHHLYLHCEGQRHGAVVVLEEGLNEDTTIWSKVQPEVARWTEVCSYDREGQGRSTADGVTERDVVPVDAQVTDLKVLLEAAGVRGPYVLVGHSAGGLVARRFARDFPGLVTGMVLLDSAHEEQTWRFKAIDPASVQGPPADPARVRAAGGLLAGQTLQWHDDIPLLVIEHGMPFAFDGSLKAHAAEFEACMHAMQVDLARRSSKGEMWTALRSGHDIMLDEPELVVRGVRRVWGEAR